MVGCIPSCHHRRPIVVFALEVMSGLGLYARSCAVEKESIEEPHDWNLLENFVFLPVIRGVVRHHAQSPDLGGGAFFWAEQELFWPFSPKFVRLDPEFARGRPGGLGLDRHHPQHQATPVS